MKFWTINYRGAMFVVGLVCNSSQSLFLIPKNNFRWPLTTYYHHPKFKVISKIDGDRFQSRSDVFLKRATISPPLTCKCSNKLNSNTIRLVIYTHVVVFGNPCRFNVRSSSTIIQSCLSHCFCGFQNKIKYNMTCH